MNKVIIFICVIFLFNGGYKSNDSNRYFKKTWLCDFLWINTSIQIDWENKKLIHYSLTNNSFLSSFKLEEIDFIYEFDSNNNFFYNLSFSEKSDNLDFFNHNFIVEIDGQIQMKNKEIEIVNKEIDGFYLYN